MCYIICDDRLRVVGKLGWCWVNFIVQRHDTCGLVMITGTYFQFPFSSFKPKTKTLHEFDVFLWGSNVLKLSQLI